MSTAPIGRMNDWPADWCVGCKKILWPDTPCPKCGKKGKPL